MTWLKGKSRGDLDGGSAVYLSGSSWPSEPVGPLCVERGWQCASSARQTLKNLYTGVYAMPQLWNDPAVTTLCGVSVLRGSAVAVYRTHRRGGAAFCGVEFNRDARCVCLAGIGDSNADVSKRK